MINRVSSSFPSKVNRTKRNINIHKVKRHRNSAGKRGGYIGGGGRGNQGQDFRTKMNPVCPDCNF